MSSLASPAFHALYPKRFAQQALGYNSKAVHHSYSKHAEVSVPSLNDGQKQWKKNPQGIVKPAVAQVDFQAAQASGAADNAGVPMVAAGHGA
jgi:hypothetical protein